MQAISRQAQFLRQYAIDTAEQLAAHRADSDGRILRLCMERKQLHNERRRKGTQPERKQEIEARLNAIHARLKELRTEIRLCDAILIRSIQIKENLRKAKQQETEVLFHELKTEDRANAKQAHHDKAIALQQPHSFSIKDCTSPYSYTFPYCSNNVPCKKSLFLYSL